MELEWLDECCSADEMIRAVIGEKRFEKLDESRFHLIDSSEWPRKLQQATGGTTMAANLRVFYAPTGNNWLAADRGISRLVERRQQQQHWLLPATG